MDQHSCPTQTLPHDSDSIFFESVYLGLEPYQIDSMRTQQLQGVTVLRCLAFPRLMVFQTHCRIEASVNNKDPYPLHPQLKPTRHQQLENPVGIPPVAHRLHPRKTSAPTVQRKRVLP